MIHEITIDRPIDTVFGTWARFADYPRFFRHIHRVDRIAPDRLRWEARVAGVRRDWDAEITEFTPGRRLAWSATDGTDNWGNIDLFDLGSDGTMVTVRFALDSAGFFEPVSDWDTYIDDRTAEDLELFRRNLEARNGVNTR